MVNIPSHINWEINSVKFGNYDNIPIDSEIDFCFSYTDLYKEYDPLVTYKQAVSNKLKSISDKSIALCISGIDSEIVAREAVSLGLKPELYFLDIWGINNYILYTARELASELGLNLNVVSMTRDEAYNEAEVSYQLYRYNKPTYMVLPYLLDKLPDDQWPVVCEGDLTKDNYLYNFYLTEFPKKITPTPGLMVTNTEIGYWLWAIKNNRPGDYYFHSSTTELITSCWNDSDMNKEFPGTNNRSVIDKFWDLSALKFKEKTTNWDVYHKENKLIRKHIQQKFQLAQKNKIFYDIVDLTNNI